VREARGWLRLVAAVHAAGVDTWTDGDMKVYGVTGGFNNALYDPEQGLFLDYDFVEGHLMSQRPSLATFHPLFVGLVTPEKAAGVVEKLSLFEHPGGLGCTAVGAGPRVCGAIPVGPPQRLGSLALGDRVQP